MKSKFRKSAVVNIFKELVIKFKLIIIIAANSKLRLKLLNRFRTLYKIKLRPVSEISGFKDRIKGLIKNRIDGGFKYRFKNETIGLIKVSAINSTRTA